MTPVEAAWIGAFIDAEGCYNLRSQGKVYKVSVINTDIEHLSALLRLTGAGTVYGHKPNQFSKKPLFVWSLHRKNDVQALSEAIAPYSIKAQEHLRGKD